MHRRGASRCPTAGWVTKPAQRAPVDRPTPQPDAHLRETVLPQDGPVSASPAGALSTTYGPISYFLTRSADESGAVRHRASARLGFRVRNDTYLLLAIAIAIPVLVMEVASR